MLHLDQNHNTLSPPHSKANLILSNTPRPDQSSLISWSAPARDERPQFQQSQQDPASDQPTPSVNTDTPVPATEPGQESAAASDAITPGNADDPKLSDTSPTSPADATSPAVESSSSLTPPPDNPSPTFTSTGLPEGETATQHKVEGSEEADQGKGEGAVDEVDKASRASTPLSELSSAPDNDDPPEGEKSGTDDVAGGAEGKGRPTPQTGSSPSTANASSSSVKTENLNHASIAGPSNVEASLSANLPHQRPDVSRAPSIATPEPATFSKSGSTRKPDPKVITLLEVNGELLKVCVALQTGELQLSEVHAQEYSKRLQSNLTWLAAAADESRKFSPQQIPLPILEAPSYPSGDRLVQLYSDLQSYFTRDTGRQQRPVSGAGTPQPLVGHTSNGHLKRDRPDDAGDMVIAKRRRDTGESKTSTPGPATPLPHSSPVQPISSAMVQPATPPGNMLGSNVAGPSNGSPSMPPPSVPPGIVPGMNESQIANVQRARQMQLRQMQQQQQQQQQLQQHQQQQQQTMADGNRQMSPPAVQQGGMAMQNPQAQMAALNSMGPQAIHAMQVLQNPQHPVTNFLNQNVPGFQSLPIPQQVREVQKVQMMMQARQHRAQMQASGSMSGMSQGAGVSGPMGVPNGSPTRISPTGQPGAMQQQPGGPQMPGSMGGFDPRMLTASQQASLASMNPQQRQLFLMQMQQSQMRGGNAPNAMMNAQMMNAAQQQRMAASSSPHIGSPMLGGPMDNNLPSALRSNPGVPGIARSTRTPSDHAPSPMTPQLSQRSGGQMEDYQRAMMQQAQRNMAQQGGMGQMGMGNMNTAWPQQQSAQMSQGSYGGMNTPSNAAAFGGMAGGNPALAGGQQQWSPSGASFPFNAGSPSGPMDGGGPGSRQTSATPAPQSQMARNSPMADQNGLSDFDIFNWEQ